ncbi:MAG: hypothetical protein IPG94_07915 [Kineosporiaceae bacterium]|nr:hypothetical protein [Kineosporiaceae bacterium]
MISQRFRLVVPLLAAVLCAPAAMPPAVADATAEPRPATVTAMRFSTDHLELSGLQRGSVTLELDLASPDYDPDLPGSPVGANVVLDGARPGAPLPFFEWVNLSLVSGTRRDGVWRGTFHFASASRGTWRVECVLTPGSSAVSQNLPFCAPHEGVDYPSVTVVGRHLPALTIAVTPDPIRRQKVVQVTGRLTDSETGKPLSGVALTAEPEGFCTAQAARASVRTDADGRYRMSMDPRGGPTVCLIATVPGVRAQQGAPLYAGALAPLHYVVQLTARAATPTAKLTGTVRVTGRITYLYAPAVVIQGYLPRLQLQRRTRGVWLTVQTRASGSPFVLTARADARGGTRGSQVYRVVLQTQQRFVRAVSPSFVVRVT